ARKRTTKLLRRTSWSRSGLATNDAVANDLLKRALLLDVQSVKRIGLLLLGQGRILEDFPPLAFAQLGHLINRHRGFGSAVLPGRHLGLAIERIFGEQITLVTLRAESFANGRVTIFEVTFALLFAHGLDPAEFKLHLVVERIGRAENFAELFRGWIDHAQLVAKLSCIMGITENE